MVNLFSNAWQILKNKGTSLIQSPDSLKTESLILASLALVVSRIFIANVSAVNARGTAEGPYRYRESIRTSIREVCGWTFGFMVLRALQSKLRAKIGGKLGIEAAKDHNGYPLFGSFWNMLKNPTEEVKPFLDKMDLAQSLEPIYKKAQQHSIVKKFLVSDFAQKVINSRFGGQEEKFVKFLYKVCPIVVASIPTVALAGYALERFTRDHSDKVVDLVSGTLNKGATKIQSGAHQVQAQMMHYSQAIPFQGMQGYPMARQSGFQAYQTAPQPFGMSGVNAQTGPITQPVAVAPQFAGRHRAIRPMTVSRSNGFAV